MNGIISLSSCRWVRKGRRCWKSCRGHSLRLIPAQCQWEQITARRFEPSWTWCTRWCMSIGGWTACCSTANCVCTRDCSCVCSSKMYSRCAVKCDTHTFTRKEWEVTRRDKFVRFIIQTGDELEEKKLTVCFSKVLGRDMPALLSFGISSLCDQHSVLLVEEWR